MRLLREAQATARLSHANVVTVYDVGSFQDQVFVAMQYVDGRTLSAWLAERPRDRAEIMAAFGDAARGLAAAHEAGFVHRDFKPQNVMVGRDGVARVMDFGLARRIDGRESTAHHASQGMSSPTPMDFSLTQTGELLGTPLYMAPEQLRGRPADALSDQFSFCVALYQALYGQHPFFDESRPDQFGWSLLTGRVRPPAGTAVPTWLRRVVLRGLRVDPSERFSSMSTLLDALSADPARSRKRWAGGTAVAMVVAGLLVSQRVSRRPPLCRAGDDKIRHAWDTTPAGARRAAAHEAFLRTGDSAAEAIWMRVSTLLDGYARSWVTMYTDACEATQTRGDQSADVLDLRMTCLEGPSQALGALTTVLERADKKALDEAVNAALALPAIERCANVALLKAAAPPPADPRVRARVAELESAVAEVRVLTDTGRWTDAQARVAHLADQARATGYESVLADVLSAQSWLEAQTGMEKEGAQNLERGIWAAVAARRDDLAAEMAAHLVGLAGYLLGRHDDAQRWKDFSESFLRRLGPGQERTEAWLAHDWGLTQQRNGQHEEAIESIRKAIALKTRVLPPDHPDIGISWMTLADLLSEGRNYEDALSAVEKALDLFHRAYGPHSVPATYALGVRGEVLAGLERYPEAERDDRECLRYREEAEPDRPWVAYPLTALGKVLIAQGRFREAAETLDRALRIRENLEHNPGLVAETEFALARALRGGGQAYLRARLLGQRALETYRGVPGQAKQVAEITRWLSEGPRSG